MVLVVGMLTDEERDYLGKMTRVMQIIVAALAFGVISFLGVVLVLIPPAAPGERTLTYLSAIVGFFAPVVAIFAPRLIESKQREAIASGAGTMASRQAPETIREVAGIVSGYQTRLIIRAAFIEGAAFFATVAYMIERQPLSLAVAGALLLALLSCFPTRSKVEEAVENERREIRELRQMGAGDAR